MRNFTLRIILVRRTDFEREKKKIIIRFGFIHLISRTHTYLASTGKSDSTRIKFAVVKGLKYTQFFGRTGFLRKQRRDLKSLITAALENRYERKS